MSTTTTAHGGELPSSDDHLETPTLDRESAALLHSISEHGGYAYVSMAALATAGDFRAAEAAREMAWEQLHSGPWHSVLPVWRDAYSMACLHVARHHYGGGGFKEALRALDMGIIMGGTLLRKDLDSAIEKVSERARRTARVSEGSFEEGSGNSERRLVDREFDVSEVRSVPLFFLFLINQCVVETRDDEHCCFDCNNENLNVIEVLIDIDFHRCLVDLIDSVLAVLVYFM